MTSRKRLLTIVVGCLVASLVAGTAWAAGKQGSPEEVVIGGRTFGPEDGIAIETGEVALPRPGTISVMAVTVESRGTSYVSSDHNTFLSYIGKARAMANVWNSKRWIRASFKYSRGGNDVIAWQHSNANLSGCTWSAGSEKKKTVWDSLLPNAPVTKWHWSFVSTSPTVC